MYTVFYFRGLNTYADDHLRIGPIRAGAMHGPLQSAFQDQGINFVPLLDMKVGALEETIARAKELLLSHPQWIENQTIDFLGHSTGALIARALLHDSRIGSKVRSLLSIGAPHSGAEAASHAIAMAARKSRLLRVAKLAGWNWQRREKFISDLRPEAINTFNLTYPDIEGVQYACCLCSRRQEELSPLMRILSNITQTKVESDGLITLESQKLGKILDHFALDHLTQIGFFLIQGAKLRNDHQEEFARLVRSSVDFWSSL